MKPEARLRNEKFGSLGDIDLSCYFFINYSIVTMFQSVSAFKLNCTFFYQKMYISFRLHDLCANILSTSSFKGKFAKLFTVEITPYKWSHPVDMLKVSYFF